MKYIENKEEVIKFLILCKNKGKVNMIKKCSGEDLVIIVSVYLN